MRRIVLSVAVLGAIALSACSGGGSVLNFENNSNPDHVIITVAGTSNIARVLPGAGLPLSAVQVKGSQNGFVTGNNFRWSAALVTSGTYIANVDGQTKPCGTINLTVPGPPPVTTPLAADMGIYIAIDPTNEANIIFIPPPTFPLPSGFPVGSTVATVFPYCVVVNAQPGKITGSGLSTTFTPTGPPGSITVAVVNPLSPTQ